MSDPNIILLPGTPAPAISAPANPNNAHVRLELEKIMAAGTLVMPKECLTYFDLEGDLDPIFEFFKSKFRLSASATEKLIARKAIEDFLELELGGIPHDAQQLVALAANKLNIVTALDGHFTMDGEPSALGYDQLFRDLNLLVDRLNLHQRFGRKIVDDALGKWAEGERLKLLVELWRTINTDDPVVQAAGEAEWDKFVNAIAKPNENNLELVKLVLQHMVWQVKRKMLGRLGTLVDAKFDAHNPAYPVEYHMMPVLWGAQGGGKTKAIRRFLMPVSAVRRDVDFREISDKSNFELMRESYVLVLDEMSYADKANIENIKRLISGESSAHRILYSTAFTQVAQRATLIGASNKSLPQLITDETGTRRFFGIHALDRLDWKAINAINPTLLWQAVDYRADYLLSPYVERLAAHQEEERVKTSYEAWLVQLEEGRIPMISADGKETDYGEFRFGQRYTASELFAFYRVFEQRDYHNQRMSNVDKFGRELSRLAGKVAEVEIIKTQSSHRSYYEFRKPECVAPIAAPMASITPIVPTVANDSSMATVGTIDYVKLSEEAQMRAMKENMKDVAEEVRAYFYQSLAGWPGNGSHQTAHEAGRGCAGTSRAA